MIPPEFGCVAAYGTKSSNIRWRRRTGPKPEEDYVFAWRMRMPWRPPLRDLNADTGSDEFYKAIKQQLPDRLRSDGSSAWLFGIERIPNPF